jgi:hypothetical protein
MYNTEGLAKSARVVEPNDTARFNASKGIYLSETADVNVVLSSGDTVLFVGLAGGAIHPISITGLLVEGTTATSILVVR